eukprot:TRINITY_DN93389_c0_g1_i1.p1 TRINITY_DN93389_c0_g1~~TRINITY_DN93389_c0_g1_i1.p1  ORF type:complete len:277 (+),score=60.85 TRINITY_DN93389_c0_g1_i1:58-831(+)
MALPCRRRGTTQTALRLALLAASAMVLAPRAAWTQGPVLRRSSLRRLVSFLPAVGWGAAPGGSLGFSPADLGVSTDISGQKPTIQRDDDPKKLEEALYLISRVQEATVQQERLVTTGKFKDVQRNSITMALNMMLNNYALADQVVIASAYVNKDRMMQASAIGNEAVDALETAKEYFGTPLKVSGLSTEQRNFIVQAMQSCRQKLDKFVVFVPQDSLQLARKRVETENELNLKEFVGENGAGISNPVTLPWKTPKKP